MAAAASEPKWLEEAAKIGAQLLGTAIRHQGRCSWVGRSALELDLGGTLMTPTVSALGPDLYDGTAGIALFLSQLHSFTGDSQTKTIALEAIAHALDEAKRSKSVLGLYVGRAGIAFSAARIALLLDVPALVAPAQELMNDELASAIESAPSDVISGLAGAIIARLAWPRETARARDLETCERLGNALVDAAVQHGSTWRWSAKRAMGEGSATTASNPLTGLSHGAAGMGVALLALGARTKNERFDEVGRGAFAYEAEVFDKKEGNWPDFRINSWNPDGRAFSVGWCHGAPGIALTRLCALSLEKNAAWRHDWKAALGSCRLAAQSHYAPRGDASLCHGMAGLVEPLVEATRQGARAGQRKLREELTQIWTPLIAQGTWPSGAPSHGPNPSLMLGTAGVGWSFLRMHDPTTPSVLLPLLDANR